MPLADLDGDLLLRILPHLDPTSQGMPIAVRCRIGSPGAEFDGLLHRPPAGGLVIELERAGPSVDLSRQIASALEKIRTASSLRALCDEAATLFQDRTGYDRVMVYRFDDEGHGEVFSERRKPDLEAYLGNRYPATDIPQMARRLYERTRVRVLVDVNYEPVPLQPRLSPLTGRDLDMSLCFLRSMSPIHLQYLKNMGVGATLVVSLVVGGKLWGLVACHHYEPRFIHFELRAVCELLAEAIATRIAALESFAQSQSEIFVQRLEQRMIEAISREGDWRAAIFDSSQSILQPLGASGSALIYEGQIISTGEVPGTQEIREIGAWLDTQREPSVLATASLGLDLPQFAGIIKVASGIAVTPISNNPGEYLIWFRPERIRTVTWGGDPLKPFVIGDDPVRSVAAPVVCAMASAGRGHVRAMDARRYRRGAADRPVGGRYRAAIPRGAHADRAGSARAIQPPRSRVRAARDHRRYRRQDPADERSVQDAAAEGSHRRCPGSTIWPAHFSNRTAFCDNVDELLGHHRAWRGELLLRSEGNREKPLMVRADPVQPSRDRVLGFVLIFSDITDRKAAEVGAQPVPGRHHPEQSHQQRAARFQDRPRLSEPAVVGGRERAACGARNHLWRRNRPHCRDARERAQFDAANRRGAGASDLAFVAHVGRRQDAEIAGRAA